MENKRLNEHQQSRQCKKKRSEKLKREKTEEKTLRSYTHTHNTQTISEWCGLRVFLCILECNRSLVHRRCCRRFFMGAFFHAADLVSLFYMTLELELPYHRRRRRRVENARAKCVRVQCVFVILHSLKTFSTTLSFCYATTF